MKRPESLETELSELEYNLQMAKENLIMAEHKLSKLEIDPEKTRIIYMCISGARDFCDLDTLRELVKKWEDYATWLEKKIEKLEENMITGICNAFKEGYKNENLD